MKAYMLYSITRTEKLRREEEKRRLMSASRSVKGGVTKNKMLPYCNLT
jgi:hypothetical protein